MDPEDATEDVTIADVEAAIEDWSKEILGIEDLSKEMPNINANS